MTWLYDLSNHQPTPDLTGWDGVIAKASEGSGFKDWRFWDHINAARSLGKVHAGYHFLRSDFPIKDQVDNFTSVCPPDIAAVPDVEWIKDEETGRIISAPTLAQTREFVDRLRDKNYHVPMQYLPRWYWNYWGQPDISDLPPLWGSYYPDYVARPREAALAKLPDSARVGFGGLPMVMIQFTSSPLDQNFSAFSPEQLYTFFSTTQRGSLPGGGGAAPSLHYLGDTDMDYTLPATKDGGDEHIPQHILMSPHTRYDLVIATTAKDESDGSTWIGQMFFYRGSGNDGQPVGMGDAVPVSYYPNRGRVLFNAPLVVEMPEKCAQLGFIYSSTVPVHVALRARP